MPGPLVRFIVEAVFIVLVAVGAGLAHLSAWAIIAVMLAAWIIVALIERAISGETSRKAAELRARDERAEQAPEPVSHVSMISPEPEEPATVLPAPPQPEPVAEAAPFEEAPEDRAREEAPPAAEPEAPPVSAPAVEAPVEPPVVDEPAPGEEPPGPAVEPPPAPRLEAVPEPEPEPEPEREPEPAPQVVPFVPAGPRTWNVWELERVAREMSGADSARDEELSFLLVYLREFAAPDGSLPLDFDALVRESFGELLGAVR